MRQIDDWNGVQSARGASLIEILVSTAIVLVAAFATISFFTTQTTLSRNMTRNSACKMALDSQLNYFRQMSVSGGGYEWEGQQTSLGAGVPNAHAILTPQTEDPWIADAVLQGALSTKDVLDDSGGALVNLNAHLLARGSMGALGALYHKVPGICGGINLSDVPHKGGLPSPVPFDEKLLKNFNIQISVKQFDLVNRATESCAMDWARPQGAMDNKLEVVEKIATFPTDAKPNIGYRVKLKGSFVEASGATSTCESQDDFAFPVDREPQKLSAIINIKNTGASAAPAGETIIIEPYGAMNPERVRTCSSGSRAADKAAAKLNMQIGFSSSSGKIDPQTVFLCRDKSKQMYPNYCTKGGRDVAMSGENYDGTNAAWRPCNKATACGLPATNVAFTRSAGLVRYDLAFDNSNASAPDGLWGCEIKMDVATVDASGNFKLLSSSGTLYKYAAASRDGGLLFQPSRCYDCKKKPAFNFGALAGFIAAGALTGGVGLGVAAAGAVAGGGACMATGACSTGGGKLLYHNCTKTPDNSSKQICYAHRTTYPAWFATSATVSGKCAAIDETYPDGTSFNGDSAYHFPNSENEEGADELLVNPPAGRYCEVAALCNNGSWESPLGAGQPKIVCGHVLTETTMDTNGVVQSRCSMPIPDSPSSVAFTGMIITPSYYSGFPNQCSGRRCKFASPNKFPKDARDPSVTNYGPDYRYYEPYNNATDSGLPECT